MARDRQSPTSNVLRRILGRLAATTASDYEKLLVALTPAAAVAVFMFQPVMRFIRPNSMFIAGELLVLALIFGGLSAVYSRRRGLLLAHLTMIGLGASFMSLAAMRALGPSEWNVARCDRIQRAMLKPSSDTRDDLPEVFQALGCQPSGDFSPRKPDISGTHGPPPTMADVRRYNRDLNAALEAEMPLEKADKRNSDHIPIAKVR